MGIVTKYKFNQNLYENYLPEFNSTFTNYTITDSIDTDSYTIRTIESNSLPKLMRFGVTTTQTDREKSLLEVYECNTENVTDMYGMFWGCNKLTSLDLSNFNTSKVTAMHSMFNSCTSLTSLDLSNFNTSQVTNMSNMFNGCYSLTSLDLSNFNTSQVTGMGNMFNNCSSLTSLDVSNFNTSNVVYMDSMFNGCSSLTSLNLSNFNTEKVTNMNAMFFGCSSLTSLNLSNFNTEKVTDISGMFFRCSSLTSLNVSNFDTSKVTNMSYMFFYCSSLTSLDVSNFNTSQVTNMQEMFNNCSSLTSLDVSNFNTSQVTNMYAMFHECKLLTSLDVSNFNTSKVTRMNYIFFSCSSLTSLDVSSFDTSQVPDMSCMFQNCSSLTSLDVSNFNTSKVTTMQAMFNSCSSLTSLDVSNFDTSKVTDMSYIFNNCSKLTLLDISNFDTGQVTNINSMLTDTINLINIGMIYCNSNTINKISDLITTNTAIWHMDSKLEDLTKKSNITYKEYKMNILESDEEINLRRIGDVYDELNLETGELTQRIDEVVLDGSEGWKMYSGDNNYFALFLSYQIIGRPENIISDKIQIGDATKNTWVIQAGFGGTTNYILMSLNSDEGLESFILWLRQNPVTIQYKLATPIIKTINLKGKPSINWQGDTYLHLENNTLYPQLDCEVESINYYEVPKLKANTLYTLRYAGEPTQCIFGGLTYRTENNMILTSGSSDNLLYFDKEVRKVILIEGDVRDRNFDYFEGIESLGTVEIVTHKTNMPIFAKGGRK